MEESARMACPGVTALRAENCSMFAEWSLDDVCPPASEVLNLAGIGHRLAGPRLLESVGGVCQAAEETVCHRAKMQPIGPESARQQSRLIHASHSPG